MAFAQYLTPALLCREAVILAADLPWRMKLGAPFHGTADAEIPEGALGTCLDAFSRSVLAPAVAKAAAQRSEPWGRLMELPPQCRAARDQYRGITCRIVIIDEVFAVMMKTMMRLDFEFSRAACVVPLYHWLGEQAEAA